LACPALLHSPRRNQVAPGNRCCGELPVRSCPRADATMIPPRPASSARGPLRTHLHGGAWPRNNRSHPLSRRPWTGTSAISGDRGDPVDRVQCIDRKTDL